MYPVKISWYERIQDRLQKRYPCDYCHRACPQQSKWTDKVNTELSYWDCDKCQAKYWGIPEDKTIKFLIYLDNDEYGIYLRKNSTSIYLNPQEFGSEITSIPYRLNITPQNAKDKLKTILTFL